MEELALKIRDALEPIEAPRMVRTAMTRLQNLQKTSKGHTGQTPEGAQYGDGPSRSADEFEETVEKPGPATRIVDPMGRADHTTISEAIREADFGDRILVRPGLHQEGLVIDKPLVMIGNGDPEEIVLQAVGANAILFKTTMDRVTNRTLRQLGGGDWYCVNATQGKLLLEYCDISSGTLSCVAISGGADPRLRRNRITKNGIAAIWSPLKGGGDIEENDLRGNTYGAWKVSSESDPLLKRSGNLE